MLSKKRSSVARLIYDKKDYSNIHFNDLLERQHRSSKKDNLSQLEHDGFGFICLQNKLLNFSKSLWLNTEILLQKSEKNIFRTAEDNNKDPTRKQIVTTPGNELSELMAVNNNIKHGIDVMINNIIYFFHYSILTSSSFS